MTFFNEDKAIIWDTEFTSWEGCHENGWDNGKGQYKEIIQIGAVLVGTDSMEIVDEFDRFVKPQINSKLSDYIKNLTGITQEDVNQAETFENVLEEFLGWSNHHNLYSYFNDLDVLKRNIELYRLEKDLQESRFRDITPLFVEHGISVDQWSSGNIARYFDKDVDLLGQHNALHDAKNMVTAFQLMKKKSQSSES